MTALLQSGLTLRTGQPFIHQFFDVDKYVQEDDQHEQMESTTGTSRLDVRVSEQGVIEGQETATRVRQPDARTRRLDRVPSPGQQRTTTDTRNEAVQGEQWSHHVIDARAT